MDVEGGKAQDVLQSSNCSGVRRFPPLTPGVHWAESNFHKRTQVHRHTQGKLQVGEEATKCHRELREETNACLIKTEA